MALTCEMFAFGSLFESDSSGWSVIGSAPANVRVSLLFAIKNTPKQKDQLFELATNISTPGHKQFRQYLTFDDMNARFAPPTDLTKRVVAYLEGALLNLTVVEAGQNTSSLMMPVSSSPRLTFPATGWIRVDSIPVKEAERLLETQFQVFAKVPTATRGYEDIPPTTPHYSDEPIIRAAGEYSLPRNIAEAVDFVGGTTHMPGSHFEVESFHTSNTLSVNSFHSYSAAQVDRSYVVTPALLRKIYEIPDDERGSNSSDMVQLTPAFLEQYFKPSDLQTYLIRHEIEPVMGISRIIGLNIESAPGGEASLDTQLIMGLAPGVKTEFWSFSGRRDNTLPPSPTNQEPFLDWLVLLQSMRNPPLVHSVSYADDEKDCTVEYMVRLDLEFQKAAVRGISILFASGDDGIGSVDTRAGIKCKQANPNFPSSSPWITSVGGTQLALPSQTDSWANPANRSEIFCSSATGCAITGGGGFSHQFLQPSYQEPQVKAYLEQVESATPPLLPPSSWFRRDGRVYPDISALATNYEIILNGYPQRTGGTSASAPVIAAMISLWNERLIKAGEPPVGFINPWLYELHKKYGEQLFNDVTKGESSVYDSSCEYLCHRFAHKNPFTVLSMSSCR